MGRVVVDANVIVSAAFGGKPLRAIARAMNDHEVLVSGPIIDELTTVFPKLSRKLTTEQIAFLNEKVRELVAMAELVAISAEVSISRDAKDDHYLALCKESGADILITGDKDLLAITPARLRKNGIFCRILAPQQFLEMPERGKLKSS